jgi:hypothetical protein
MNKNEPTDKEIFDTNNYIAFTFESYITYMLPHKEANILFSLLEKMEKLDSNIYDIKNGKIKMHKDQIVQFDAITVSRKQYREIKVRHLIGEPENTEPE